MRKFTVISIVIVMCVIMVGVLTPKDEERDIKEDPKQEVTITNTNENRLTAGAGNYIKEYAQIKVTEEPEVTKEPEVTVEPTPESYIYNDPLNQKFPYNVMSADWGSEVYESGFTYYEIPQKYKDDGGEFPEVVQVYLWELCKEKKLNYYLVVALLEHESHYKYDCLGDYGNSFGYMQIYQKYHIDRMKKEQVADLMDPYGNMRVGTTFLQELYEGYGSSGDNCVLMVYNMGTGGAKKLWRKGIYSSEYSREIIKRSKEIEQELKQD